MEQVRLLDGLVRYRFGKDSELMAAWEFVNAGACLGGPLALFWLGGCPFPEQDWSEPDRKWTMAVHWDIRREGRPWLGDEFPARWELTPEKFETLDGRIFLSENDRINLLALLLENIGVDAAVRLGSPEIWEAAVAASRGAPREEVSRRPGGWEDGYEGQYGSGETFLPGPRSPGVV